MDDRLRVIPAAGGGWTLGLPFPLPFRTKGRGSRMDENAERERAVARRRLRYAYTPVLPGFVI